MNLTKYRKWVLSENWGNNEFHMVIHRVGQYKRFRGGQRKNHPLVLSHTAYWVNDHELCIGYEMYTNPAIFRPIFSHKRQRLLDQVHVDIMCPTAFWRAVKMRYYLCLSQLRKIPLDCVAHLVHFIY